MRLTYEDFEKGTRLYFGKLECRFSFIGREIFKLQNGEYYQNTGIKLLPVTGYFPDIEIYEVSGKTVLVLLKNHYYVYVEKIKVIESRTIEPFTGFEPNKRYELQNGQIWQQVDGPCARGYTPCPKQTIWGLGTACVCRLGATPVCRLASFKPNYKLYHIASA